MIFVLYITCFEGVNFCYFSLGKEFEMWKPHREFPFMFGRQFGGRFSLEKILGTEITLSIMDCASVTRKRRGGPHFTSLQGKEAYQLWSYVFIAFGILLCSSEGIWNIVPLLCFDIESNANIIITFKDQSLRPSQALCLIPWFLKFPSSFEHNSLFFFVTL